MVQRSMFALLSLVFTYWGNAPAVEGHEEPQMDSLGSFRQEAEASEVLVRATAHKRGVIAVVEGNREIVSYSLQVHEWLKSRDDVELSEGLIVPGSSSPSLMIVSGHKLDHSAHRNDRGGVRPSSCDAVTFNQGEYLVGLTTNSQFPSSSGMPSLWADSCGPTKTWESLTTGELAVLSTLSNDGTFFIEDEDVKQAPSLLRKKEDAPKPSFTAAKRSLAENDKYDEYCDYSCGLYQDCVSYLDFSSNNGTSTSSLVWYCADNCDEGRCEVGQDCILNEVQCFQAPCPPIAECIWG